MRGERGLGGARFRSGDERGLMVERDYVWRRVRFEFCFRAFEIISVCSGRFYVGVHE